MKIWMFKKHLFLSFPFLILLWFAGSLRHGLINDLFEASACSEGEFFIGRFSFCLYTLSLKLCFLAEGVCPFFLHKSLTDVLPAWMNHHAVTLEPTPTSGWLWIGHGMFSAVVLTNVFPPPPLFDLLFGWIAKVSASSAIGDSVPSQVPYLRAANCCLKSHMFPRDYSWVDSPGSSSISSCGHCVSGHWSSHVN